MSFLATPGCRFSPLPLAARCLPPTDFRHFASWPCSSIILMPLRRNSYDVDNGYRAR
jgi:hypothetical protein